MLRYREEFPDFPAEDMPNFPEGWTDSSWHNDICPSRMSPDDTIQVFVDYADPDRREMPELPRFSVSRLSESDNPETLLESDDWSEVLAFIQTL